MINEIVLEYLTIHRRLVIPNLGAFLVKQPSGEVIFSEFLKQDDGILRQLLKQKGLSDMEAAGTINRYVFELKHAITENGSIHIEGIGTLKAAMGGKIEFDAEVHIPTPVKTIEKEPKATDTQEDTTIKEEIQQEPEAINKEIAKPQIPTITTKVVDPDLEDLSYGTTKRRSRYSTSKRKGADYWLIRVIIAVLVIATAIITYLYFTAPTI